MKLNRFNLPACRFESIQTAVGLGLTLLQSVCICILDLHHRTGMLVRQNTMPIKRVTLKDVAQAAGVATGTVSMVLNDNPLVADATKARVRAVINEVGYVYDRA